MATNFTYDYTVVTPVKDAARYLPDYIRSLEAQTTGLERVEVLLVDDGSRDASPELMADFARRWSPNVRVITRGGEDERSGGPAAARNAALPHAGGEWLTFIDADDTVAVDYFERIDDFRAAHEDRAGMLCSRLLIFQEASGVVEDTHPLGYRLRKGNRLFTQEELEFGQLHINTFFRTAELRRLSLTFDERIVPMSEDANFIARYLLRTGCAVGLVAEAEYHYRKRAGGESTLQRAHADPRSYDDVLRLGFLPPLEEASATGDVPQWLQRTALYHLQWEFRRESTRRVHPSMRLSLEQAKRFLDIASEILSYIDGAVLRSRHTSIPRVDQLAPLLVLADAQEAVLSPIVVGNYDPQQRLMRLRYLCRSRPAAERYIVGGRDVEPVAQKWPACTYAGETLLEERIVWIPMREDARALMVELDGVTQPLVRNRYPAVHGSPDEFLRMRYPARRVWQTHPKGNLNLKGLPLAQRLRARAIRWLASRRIVKRRYRRVWLLMDRDVNAGDNAEALYRWIMRNRPERNVRFVIRRDAPDYRRLKQEGFRILPFLGFRWHLAMLNASVVASSHADVYCTDPLPRSHFGDRLKYRFVFLQHGVIKDDMSTWLGNKKLDLFITSTASEHRSVVGDGSRYPFTEREVRLTGMPRHDELLERANEVRRDIVLIMPTWRKWLQGPVIGNGWKRDYDPTVARSEYVARWSDFLSRPELVAGHTLEVVFHPHPNMQPYLDSFPTAEGVRIATEHDMPMRDLLARTHLLVTDFSSVSFDVALAGGQVLYYQFDEVRFFSEQWDEGYFDYRVDGFGPVEAELQPLLARYAEAMRSMGPSPIYAGRTRKAFATPDGRNAERVYEAIRTLRRRPKVR